MRIFKRKFKEDLTEGMSIGECIITKVDNLEYGQFIVHRKVKEGSFPFLGLFSLLENAVKFVQVLEQNELKYEYYLQSQVEREEGLDRGSFEVMGQLGWELCGIDSNITDNKGRSMYIYKRVIPIQQVNEFESELEESNNSNFQDNKERIPTYDYKQLRDNISPRVDDFQYSSLSNSEVSEINVNFGKNGLGLTSELIIIGEKIAELSKTGLIYMKESFIDTLDDVYSLTFVLKPFVDKKFDCEEVKLNGTVEPIYSYKGEPDYLAFARGAIKKYGVTMGVINYIKCL